MSQTSLFIGPIIHSVDRDKVEIIMKAGIVVKEGKIEAVKTIIHDSHEEDLIKEVGPAAQVVILEDGQFLIPGFIDTHIHASQMPNIGIGYDKSLLEWLKSYTFPLESKYEDENFATDVYTAVVNRTLRCGTTTAVYFGTIHRNSCYALARIIQTAGQRALVGKVNMDRLCRSELLEETEDSLQNTRYLIDSVQRLETELVKIAITPRFAITCTPLLLKELGDIAREHDLHIQTHVSENRDEIEVVRDLFPEAKNYTEVYDQANLLTRKTILAHGVYLDDDEVGLIKQRGCTIAHCPNSNICLKNGLCDVRKLLDAGINVALGTDVSGGCNPSILDAIRCTLSTSNTLSLTRSEYKSLTYHEAFYMATMGGAIALDMEDKVGNFDVGKYFDAIIVTTRDSDTPFDIFEGTTLSELFQKFIYLGNDRNILAVYVNGRLVMRKSDPVVCRVNL